MQLCSCSDTIVHICNDNCNGVINTSSYEALYVTTSSYKHVSHSQVSRTIAS